MSYLQNVIDWIESEQFEYECDEDVNDTFERIDDEWKPNNRFSITKLLNINNEIPDLMLYLQEQIDNECEDTTETITFPPERDEPPEISEEEIDAVKAELSQARQDLSRIKAIEREERKGGIVEGIKSFIRNIFRG